MKRINRLKIISIGMGILFLFGIFSFSAYAFTDEEAILWGYEGFEKHPENLCRERGYLGENRVKTY